MNLWTMLSINGFVNSLLLCSANEEAVEPFRKTLDKIKKKQKKYSCHNSTIMMRLGFIEPKPLKLKKNTFLFREFRHCCAQAPIDKSHMLTSVIVGKTDPGNKKCNEQVTSALLQLKQRLVYFSNHNAIVSQKSRARNQKAPN